MEGHQHRRLVAAPGGARRHRLCPEDRRIFAELSVWENLDVAALVRHAGRGHWNLDAVYDLFPETAELRSRQGGFCPVASSRC